MPYIILAIVSQNSIYYFPELFTLQYSALFYPFVFLGLIDVIAFRKLKENQAVISTKNNYQHKFIISNSTKTVLSILIILILMSAGFQPWSPIVKDNNYVNYYYSTNPYDNQHTYTYLSDEAELIPRSNPYVLVPNNIPEAYPRSLINGPYSIGELVMGFSNPVFKNISLGDVINNTFPYIAWNGTVVNIPIDYAWGTLTDNVFYAKSGYQSMFDIMQLMLESEKYGILAEANGTILLKRGYTGSPLFYVPMDHYVAPNNGIFPVPVNVVNKSYGFNNISSGETMWYGGTVYPPGIFNTTFNFVLSPDFHGNISIKAISNGSMTAVNYINRNYTGKGYVNISFNQTFFNIRTNTYNYYIIQSNGFTGQILFQGISIKETSI